MRLTKKGFMKVLPATVAIAGATLCGCSGMSREEKELIGDYYNQQLSDKLPMFELKDDGTSVVRNIDPGVLVMEIDGTWSLTGDSLVIVNDQLTLRLQGDTSIVGEIAPRVARRIVSHDGRNIIMSKDNIEYLYIHRKHRPHKTSL